MIQMLEDTLIEHAHTKPLLPSQLIRYREVQVPDGRTCTETRTHTHTCTHALQLSTLNHHLPVMAVSTVTMQESPFPALLPSSSVTLCCVCLDLIKIQHHLPLRNIIVTQWKWTSLGKICTHLLLSSQTNAHTASKAPALPFWLH